MIDAAQGVIVDGVTVHGLAMEGVHFRDSSDGYQTHGQQPGWGCGTVFKGNTSTLTGATGPTQLAIDVTDFAADCPTTVSTSNTVTGGKGLTNIGVTPSRGLR